jgi:hypothetical protein
MPVMTKDKDKNTTKKKKEVNWKREQLITDNNNANKKTNQECYLIFFLFYRNVCLSLIVHIICIHLLVIYSPFISSLPLEKCIIN